MKSQFGYVFEMTDAEFQSEKNQESLLSALFGFRRYFPSIDIESDPIPMQIFRDSFFGFERVGSKITFIETKSKDVVKKIGKLHNPDLYYEKKLFLHTLFGDTTTQENLDKWDEIVSEEKFNSDLYQSWLSGFIDCDYGHFKNRWRFFPFKYRMEHFRFDNEETLIRDVEVQINQMENKFSFYKMKARNGDVYQVGKLVEDKNNPFYDPDNIYDPEYFKEERERGSL